MSRVTTRRVYIETYGCQMNVADSELIASILSDSGFHVTRQADQADILLLNTCAVREHAEERVIGRSAAVGESGGVAGGAGNGVVPGAVAVNVDGHFGQPDADIDFVSSARRGKGDMEAVYVAVVARLDFVPDAVVESDQCAVLRVRGPHRARQEVAGTNDLAPTIAVDDLDAVPIGELVDPYVTEGPDGAAPSVP